MSIELSAPLEEQAPASPGWKPVGSGFGIRAAAQILDMLVHLGIWTLLSLVLVIGFGIYQLATGISADSLLQKATAASWSDYIAGPLGFALYHAAMESKCGATVGKRVLRLVVTNTAGGLVSYRQALWRSLMFYIDSLFFGLIAYRSMKPPLRQRLGDKRNDTLVVRKSLLPPGTAAGMSHFGSALWLGFLLDAGCGLISAGIDLL